MEKSIKRQIHNLQSTTPTPNNNNEEEEQLQQLQTQLQSIAMDQLYISFYPTTIKYMGLFTNGNERVIDNDTNGNKERRKRVWNMIRSSLLEELNDKKDELGDANN